MESNFNNLSVPLEWYTIQCSNPILGSTIQINNNVDRWSPYAFDIVEVKVYGTKKSSFRKNLDN